MFRLLALLCCGLVCALAQDIHHFQNKLNAFIKPGLIPLNSPISMFLRHHEDVTYEANLRSDLNCTNFNTTDPNNPLMKYLSHSGTSVNDFGFFDSCKDLQGDREMMAMSPPLYVIFGLPFTGYVAKWGVCMPQYCFYQIYNTLNVQIQTSLHTELVVVNSNLMDDYDLSGWKSIFMICILVFFFLIGLVGSVIENTSIGDKSYLEQRPLLEDQNSSSHVMPNQQSTLNINGTAINGTLQRSQASSFTPASESATAQRVPSDPFARKQCWARFLMCFSISYNLKKFVTRGREASPLDVLDGVRVLSIFWVILGHSYFYPMLQGNSVRNTPEFPQFFKEFLFTMIPSGFLAVDSFFFMSAFLGAYIFLVKAPRQFSPNMIAQVPIAYFHRIYRLTPLLAFIIYFGAYVLYPLASGPSGNAAAAVADKCDKYGWADLVYINNFYPEADKVCEGQTWYLANDMQLFLLLPWFMIIYRVNKILGYAILGACLIANLAVSFYISYQYNIGIGILEPSDFFKLFYEKPWVRATPYLVGIFSGIVYYEYKEELKIAKRDSLSNVIRYRGSCAFQIFNVATHSTFMTLIYFVVGFGITFACVFVPYPYQREMNPDYWSKGAKSTYNMLARGMFVFGLFLVLIPLLAGRLTMLREFLGNQLFHVMAKSTYAVYLIHEMFLLVFGLSERSYKYFIHLDGIVTCLSMIVLSYLIGSFFTLLIDSPLGNIDKTFLFPPKKKKPSYPPMKTVS